MNSKGWSGLALLAWLGLPLAVSAQDADAVNTASGDRFQVVGTVVDRQTGEPIPGALVEFRQVGVDGDAAWTGHADELGRFVTPGLVVGGYQIGVEALSYSSLNHIEIFPDAAVMDLRVEVVPWPTSSSPSWSPFGGRIGWNGLDITTGSSRASDTSSDSRRSRLASPTMSPICSGAFPELASLPEGWAREARCGSAVGAPLRS
jgi:hypothetical protein